MTLSLLCVPFAGSGAGFYRGWPNGADQGIRIVPLQMPGREERFLEDPYKDAAEAAKDLAGAALRLVGGAQRVVLFGHSLGAVLAYETARELQTQGFTALEHLFVSGSPVPGAVVPGGPPNSTTTPSWSGSRSSPGTGMRHSTTPSCGRCCFRCYGRT